LHLGSVFDGVNHAPNISIMHMMIDEDGDLYVSQNNTHTQWFQASTRNLHNIGTISNSGNITSTGSAHTFYSGGGTGEIAVGRSVNQEIEIFVDDTNNKIIARQDSDSNGTHRFILDRYFAGTGANTFHIRKDGSDQLLIDDSGRVFINTTTSLDNNAQLHIKGFSSGHAGITMQDQDNTNTKTFFKQTSGATEIQTQNNTAHGVFKVTGWNGTASAEFMRVDGASGRVGIGTSSPSEKLEISGGKLLVSGGQIRSGSYLESFPSFSFANDTDTGMFSDTANQLEFSTGGDSKVTINATGHLLVHKGEQSVLNAQSGIDRGVWVTSDTDGDTVAYNLAVPEGNNNRRLSFYLDDANGLSGINSTASTGSCPIAFKIGGTERARIDGGGLDIKSGGLDINGTEVINSSRNLTNIGTISSGKITANTGDASAQPLTIGSSASTNYTLQNWITTAHAGVSAYMIAYGASHSSQAGNFAMKNIASSGEIYFELQSGVEPLRLTSTGATFAGTISSGAITSTGVLTINEELSGDTSQLVINNTQGATLRMGITGSGANEAAHIKTNFDEALEFHIGQASNTATPDITFLANGGGIAIQGTTVINSSRNLTNIGTISSGDITVTTSGITSTLQGNDLIFNRAGPSYIRQSGGGSLNFSTSTSNTIALTLDASQNATFAGDIDLADSKKIKLGASDDLQIYHNGTHSYINQSGTGDLFIRNTTDDGDVYIQSDNGSGGITSFLKADGGNGTLQLFHYGSLKASTTSAGISVTGEVNLTGELEINGTDVIDSSRNLVNIGTISSTNITSNGAAVVVQSKPLTVLNQPVNISSPNNSRIRFLQTTSGASATKGSIQWFDSNSNSCGTIRVVGDGVEDNSGKMEFFVTAQTDELGDDPFGINKMMTITENGVTVHGSLSKSSGSFRIDHPLKPETHDLVHSFVEGPQADNLYRGVIKLENGRATVDLDEWFDMTAGTFLALNRDIQAFVNNSETWDAVRAKVMGSQLVIECQNPESSAEVSWLVIGERQDKEIHKSSLTNDNGKIIVEPEKVG
jgi:hypothetical protein